MHQYSFLCRALYQCSFPWGAGCVCVCVCVCVCSIAQACSTLCKSPMDWSLPRFSAHGVVNYKWSQWFKPWLTSVQSLQVFVEMTLCIVWSTKDFQSHSNLDRCSSVSREWPQGSLDWHFGVWSLIMIIAKLILEKLQPWFFWSYSMYASHVNTIWWGDV